MKKENKDIRGVRSIRNGGRPRLKEEDRKDKPISFRTDSLTRIAIEEKLKESKLCMSEFLRRALKNAEITPAEYEGYFREIENFSSARLVDMVAVSAIVVQPWSDDELKSLKSLYRFAGDINALIKRGNASLEKLGVPIDERIDYRLELARLQDEFNEMKDYFIRRVVGDNTK